MRNYYVYIHTNKLNNKKYIGITCQEPKERWQNGLGYRNQLVFWNAIIKYGWNNFDHYVFPDKYTEEEAKLKEIALIADYHTCILDEQCLGYNMTRGGEGGCKYITKEERKQAHIDSYKKANKKKYLQIKNDQEAYDALLEYNRLNKRYKLTDPIEHEKLKAYNRADMAKRRQDPVYAEKQREAHRQTSKKVTQLRQELLQLLQDSSDLFSKDEIEYITAKTKNGYKNQSIKKLSEIKARIIEKIEQN